MDTDQLEGVLKFFKNSEQLKDTTRSAYTSKAGMKAVQNIAGGSA